MMPSDAHDALDTIAAAQRRVVQEVGLPRGYWWAMAAAWMGLGAIGQFGPQWLIIAATIAFGAVHSALASRLLAGRNRTGMLQVSAEVTGNRVALIVIGMLLTFVAMQVLAAVALDADGADHSQLWAAGMVALTVGFGGPEVLRTLLRLGRS